MAEKQEQSSKGSLERFAPLLLIAVVAMAFVIGALWQKTQVLSKSTIAGTTANKTQNAANPTTNPQAAVPTTGQLTEEQASKVPPVTKDDHFRGSLDADVFLVEYSDYYCPFCSRFHPTAQQALEEYGQAITWVYRHFPLDTLHPNARPLAEISECITELGGEDAFWVFTDAVYENVPTDAAAAIDLAATQGINKTALQTCFDEGRYKDKVETQYQAGLTAGITGTPGNFIINKAGSIWKLPGAVPFENLKTTIDQALGS